MAREWESEILHLARTAEMHIRQLRADKTAELAPSPDFARGARYGEMDAWCRILGSLRHLLGLCPRCAALREPGSSISVCSKCRKELENSMAPACVIPEDPTDAC